MGSQLFELELWLRRLVGLPAALWERIRWQRRYRRDGITVGCAGVMVITEVDVYAVTPIGPWEVSMGGISLIDGTPCRESSDCSPDLVSLYLAQVLVGCRLGLDREGLAEHFRRLQEQVPELRTLLG